MLLMNNPGYSNIVHHSVKSYTLNVCDCNSFSKDKPHLPDRLQG